MTSGADNRLRRRKQLPDPSSTLGASTLCAWQVPGTKEWRVQSRVPSVSHYLRYSLKLPRVGYSVLGGHLNIFKVTRRNAGSWAKRFVNTNGGTVLE